MYTDPDANKTRRLKGNSGPCFPGPKKGFVEKGPQSLERYNVIGKHDLDGESEDKSDKSKKKYWAVRTFKGIFSILSSFFFFCPF